MEDTIEIESESENNDDSDDQLIVEDYLHNKRVDTCLANRINNRPVYTSEELEKISAYKNAIAINRERQNYYQQLEDTLIKMLAKVRKKLKDNEAVLLKQSFNRRRGGFNYVRCGKPYFKDDNNFFSPDNEDTIMMKQAQMYDFSQVSSISGWTIKDKTELANALLEASREIRKKELRAEISRLNKDTKNLVEIANLEREITQLEKKSLSEIALPLDQEYDWEDLAASMNRRHTAQEYQALWKLFFHPSINKQSWSKAEQELLQKIASAHNFQDWESIAKELNTGRTAYQCFVYYRTNMVIYIPNRKWTSDEEECLLHSVEFFREGKYIPWGKVASAMDGRTKMQVYNKYMRLMESRKGRFLEEEDVVLLNCHRKYGNDFKKMTKFLPGRSVAQLKTRFNILTKAKRSTTWTVEEDRKLIQLMANLDPKISFSSATKHFPGKDRTNIRSRYVTLAKWMKSHPGSDLSLAPRRNARRLLHGHEAVDLKEAITNLNRRLENEVHIKKKNKITMQSSEEEIEQGIMALLVNEMIKEESHKKTEQLEIFEDPICPLQEASPKNENNLCNLLVFMNASLNKHYFDNGKYALEYPKLSESLPGSSQVTVKSYSRVKSKQTVEIKDFPDIWGQKPRLQHTFYVLPPNYATITGCRVLMKHYGAKPLLKTSEELNLSLLQRRNSFLKYAMETLKERFTTLFMWPIILSNELPETRDEQYEPVNSKLQPPRNFSKMSITQHEIDTSEDDDEM